MQEEKLATEKLLTGKEIGKKSEPVERNIYTYLESG